MFLAFHLLLLPAFQTCFLAHNLMPIQSTPSRGVGASGNSRVYGESGSSGQLEIQASEKIEAPTAPEPLPACLELKGEPIDVQECLQSVVRELQWRVGENHASEYTGSSVRYLNDENLEKYADSKVLLEPLEFTGGKLAVLLRTQELNEGDVRAHIQHTLPRRWEPTDKVSGQSETLWPLNSKAILEQELIGALQTRFKHA